MYLKDRGWKKCLKVGLGTCDVPVGRLDRTACCRSQLYTAISSYVPATVPAPVCSPQVVAADAYGVLDRDATGVFDSDSEMFF